jgi:hypothetical protein
MANQWSPILYAALREFKATNRRLPARYGAHAWGIGRKEVQGRRTDELVLRFYVERKQPEAALGLMLVPTQIEFTSPTTGRVTTLGTDVIERPKGKLDADPESRIRPIPGGVSFGTILSTGTLGGWCWDTTDHTLVALSNSHVLAPVGAAVQQPGPSDDGKPEDKMGTTKRIIPLHPAPQINQVDCAIAAVDLPSDVAREVLEIGPALFFITPPILDLAVEKFGQTTEHTFGVIVDVDLSASFEEDKLEFDDCLFIDPVSPTIQWSDSGDSGALVFSQTPVSGTSKPAVGLHFGHSGASGFACKIQPVLDQLALTTICDGQITALAESMLADPTSPPRPFGALPRAIQSQFAASRSGKLLTDALDLHRVEIVQLVQNPAIQRSLIDALRPIVAGATTADELLARTITSADIVRLGATASLLASRASIPLASVIDQLSALTARAQSRTLRDIFGVS